MTTTQFPWQPAGARAGVPTIAQIVWLAAAVAAEIVLLAVLIRRAAPHGERAVVLTILGIVGAHFLPMAPAFGPPMILLGLPCAANVLLAARLTGYSLRSVWAVDGALKAAIGALLVWQPHGLTVITPAAVFELVTGTCTDNPARTVSFSCHWNVPGSSRAGVI